AIPAAVGLVTYDLYLINQINNANEQNAEAEGTIKQLEQDLQNRTQERKAYKRRCSEPPPAGLTACERAKWILQRNKDCYEMRYNYGTKWFNDGFKNHEEEMRNVLQSIKNAEEEVKRLCTPCPGDQTR